MNLFSSFIFSIFTFLVIFFGAYYLIDSEKSKRILYTYPNGVVANTNSSNSKLLGYNIEKDTNLPEIVFSEEEFPIQQNSDFKTNLEVAKDFILQHFLVYSVLFTAFWFLIATGDFFLFFFFLNFALLIASNIFMLGFTKGYTMFYFSIFQTSFLILHFAYRIKGKDISTKWFIPEIAFSSIIAFVGYAEENDFNYFVRLVKASGILGMVASSGAIIVSFYDTIKYSSTTWQESKKVLMSFSVFIAIIFTYFLFENDLLKDRPNLLYLHLLLLFLIPITFIYGFFKYSFFPKQLYFSSTLTIFYLFSFISLLYLCLYWLFIQIAGENPDYLFLFNFLFIFFTVIFISQIKNFVVSNINYWTFQRSDKYTNALEEMSKIISNPTSTKQSVKKLFNKMTDVLGVKKIILLLTPERFPGLEFRDVNITKLPSSSDTWKYFSKTKDITVTSYLSHGSGNRNSAYKFLRKLEIQISYPMYGLEYGEKISSVLLIGEKLNGSNFSVGEIQFIKECSRLADLLLQNYKLLISEIEKKRMERDLSTIELMQNTIFSLSLGKNDFSSIDLSYISVPALGVTGDYIDLVKLSDTKLYIFIGDVTGHGVGSGFLVSAIRAFVRDQIQMGIELKKLFKNLNTLLLERYSGSEFMSLVGGIFNLETSEFEFVNAGHLSPILYRNNSKIELVKSSARVLGVLPTIYTTDSIILSSGDMVLFYTDGVTETFSPSEEIYGEKRLIDCVQKNSNLDSNSLIELILKDLEDFRKGEDKNDDVTLLSLKKL
ncbi:MAG: PP2C family protein-serine/threonine phosphatase [Leptospiraceae bacterium]|nr:PP2C family protein-serine/threonine phosphatase [Leptospiraceae bacterium]